MIKKLNKNGQPLDSRGMQLALYWENDTDGL